MERILAGLEPQRLYWYFEELTRIPRGSGNEAAVADFIVAEAEKNGLWVYRDALNNVLVKKPGCGGLENAAPVILQGHVDVVCEKNNDVVHDFTKDPVDIYIEDGWLKARGTTLGADNGTACAMMLALMEEKGGKHPPLECFFTVQEEVGMVGAQNFDYTQMQGRTLLNMDGGVILKPVVSCAGAEYDFLTFALDRSPAAGQGVKVTLTGLAGGHSGTGIRRGLANSILLLGRILSQVRETVPFRIAFMEGGNKANAIPRECTATLVTTEPEKLTKAIAALTEEVRRELIEADQALSATCQEIDLTEAFSEENTEKLLTALTLVPNGVLSFMPANPELVESSSNTGVIRTEGDQVVLTVMPRSSLESRMDQIAHKLDVLARQVGAEIVHNDRHPGWEYAPQSRLRDVYAKVCRDLLGVEPAFRGMHAGLECGVIGKGLGGVDAVSFGAHAMGAHTPKERLELSALAETYDFLKHVLAEL